MPDLRISRRAGADLDYIRARGLEEFGVESTRKHMAEFERKFALLRSHPMAGPAYPEYGRAVRGLLHAPHRIMYRFENGMVSIMRILHISQRSYRIDDTRQ